MTEVSDSDIDSELKFAHIVGFLHSVILSATKYTVNIEAFSMARSDPHNDFTLSVSH